VLEAQVLALSQDVPSTREMRHLLGLCEDERYHLSDETGGRSKIKPCYLAKCDWDRCVISPVKSLRSAKDSACIFSIQFLDSCPCP
jgi:hypothetical protein